MFFHQKQEMNSSDFFRAHWSRHLCCKALVDWQAPVQPTTIEGDISPSLADPALLSVVVVVDGQFTGFITKERRNFIYTSTERTGPGFSAFKASADRPAQRTRPLTSYPVSQSRVLPTKSRSWSRVFTDQEGRKCVLQNSRLL